MNARQLQIRLSRAKIYVKSTRQEQAGKIFDLYCGAQITIYRTGTVVVRGKIKPYSYWDAVAALEQVLPANTRWNHSFA